GGVLLAAERSMRPRSAIRRTIETIASRGIVGSLLRVSRPKRYARSRDSGSDWRVYLARIFFARFSWVDISFNPSMVALVSRSTTSRFLAMYDFRAEMPWEINWMPSLR